MIRLSYRLTALEPLMHGSDNQNTGNKRMFRRERHRLPNPQRIASSFDDDTHRRHAALCILFGVYKSIDSKLKSDYYGYYDPFASAVIAATHNRTKFEFLNSLCDACGVRTISERESARVMIALDRFSDAELMYTMQRETQYLMLMLRDFVKNDGQPTLFDRKPDAPASFFEKHFDDVPFISGNAVGGLIRRLAVRDFFRRIGYEKETMGVDKSTYHELMTGGNISESTGQIVLKKKERIAKLCPPVAVLGSALGSMTTTSMMKIGSLRPVCSELGFDGAPSYWELLGTDFGTRHDTSKAETEIDIAGTGEERNADQMIYYNEVLNAGTELWSDMLFTGDDDVVMESCFWHMVGLWKDFGYIAGRSARGHGRVKIDIEIPENANSAYLSHLERVKDEALAYFTKKRIRA